MKIYYFIIVSAIILLTSCNANVSCGFDDGPFQATVISIPIDNIIENDYVIYAENSRLYYNNRDKDTCPIISCLENDSVLFSLEMNIKEYNWQLFEITSLIIKKNTKKMLRIAFLCNWTFGKEWGYMSINKKTGANNFCLSW